MTTSTATVLCLDFGSTTTSFEGASVRNDGWRLERETVVRAAVQSHRGSVIRVMGDAMMVTFAAASDGVAAARAVQAIARQPRTTESEPFVVGAGMSIGDVDFAAADCVGPPVLEASQLCAAATGGQILATDAVRLMAGMRDDPGFVAIGSRLLPGLPSSIDVVEIRWEPPPVWPSPLPSMLRATSSAFVGRRTEMATLHDAYQGMTTSAQRAIVLVSGDAGIGKTTLVSRAVQAWHAAGANVALGSCDEYLRAPYRPFTEALNQLVAGAPGHLLEAHAARHGASLAALVRELEARLPNLPVAEATDPETDRFLLYAAIGDLLIRLSDTVPLVLFFEDVHWADAATASLLEAIGTDATPARLLVLATFRNMDATAELPMGPTLAALGRLPAVTHVHLAGLRRPEVAHLVEQRTGHPVPQHVDRVVTALIEETAGNPFFVVEMLRHLEDAGQLDELFAPNLMGRRVLPDSIREVLGDRVDQLGFELREVLQTAAVIGSEFTLALLSTLTGTGDEELRALLADASRAALIREVSDASGMFAFTHALVRHAILANLGSTREIRMHRRVAEALESIDSDQLDATQLAHHWLQATRFSDTAKARDWARQAGDAALAALAPADAVTYFHQALELDEQTTDRTVTTRVDLLTRLGTAKRLAGDATHRETLLEASELALKLDDGTRLAAAVLANHSGTFSRFGGVDDERVAMLRAAVDHAPTTHDRAVLLATLANELTYAGDYPARRLIVDAALEAAQSTGDEHLLLRVRNLVFFPLWIAETLAERVEIYQDSARILHSIHDPSLRFWALTAHSLTLVQAGRLDEADPMQDEIDALADRLAQPALQWRARHRRATRDILFGQADTAEVLAREARELGLAAGEPVADVYFKLQSICLHWLRGTLSELAPRLNGESPRPANAVATICLIFAEGGRRDEARALLASQAADDFASLPRDPTFITSVAFFAEAAISLGDPTPAGPLYRLLAPFSRQVGFDGVTTVGLVEHHVGGLAALLGRGDEAVERLSRSADWHAAAGAPFFEARSRLQLAAALVRGGRPSDRPEARKHLERAAYVAAHHAFVAVQHGAARLLDDIAER